MDEEDIDFLKELRVSVEAYRNDLYINQKAHITSILWIADALIQKHLDPED